MYAWESSIVFELPIRWWPVCSIEEVERLSHPTFDDEGCSLVFVSNGWAYVDPEFVLKHPTAQWFLSDLAFSRFIPAILVASFMHISCPNQYPLERLVFDHFETNWLKRRDALVQMLTNEQIAFVDQFIVAERQFYDRIDRSECDEK